MAAKKMVFGSSVALGPPIHTNAKGKKIATTSSHPETPKSLARFWN
jgi:hypothetical protein